MSAAGGDVAESGEDIQVKEAVEEVRRIEQWLKRGGRLLATYAGLYTISKIIELRWAIFPHSTQGLLLLISVGANIFLLIEMALYQRPPRTVRVIEEKPPFEKAVIDKFEDLKRKRDFSAICRYRAAFSNLFWVEGHINERIRLGEIADEAAVTLGDKITQSAAVIDDLGWCYVAKKQYSRAQDYLNHGLAVAVEAGDPYWQAKAHRHLGGLAVEQEDYATAHRRLEAAAQLAEKVPDEVRRADMIAGIQFGLATCYYFETNHDDALRHVYQARELWESVPDPTRKVHAYALLGKIYEAKGDYQSAKDNYRRGLAEATIVGRRDEEIRNLLGMERVLRMEHSEEAQSYHDAAQVLLAHTPVPYEISDKEQELARFRAG